MEPKRDRLNAKETDFLEILTSEDLSIACDRLVHYAHWVTPDMVPKRFDTHFYLAEAPADHVAVHDGHESVDSVWISPGQVLAEAEAGTKTVIFPTLRNVEKLGNSGSVAQAIERAQADPVLPWTERRGDGNYLCIPPEAGYSISEQKMPERPPG